MVGVCMDCDEGACIEAETPSCTVVLAAAVLDTVSYARGGFAALAADYLAPDGLKAGGLAPSYVVISVSI